MPPWWFTYATTDVLTVETSMFRHGLSSKLWRARQSAVISSKLMCNNLFCGSTSTSLQTLPIQLYMCLWRLWCLEEEDPLVLSPGHQAISVMITSIGWISIFEHINVGVPMFRGVAPVGKEHTEPNWSLLWGNAANFLVPLVGWKHQTCSHLRMSVLDFD